MGAYIVEENTVCCAAVSSNEERELSLSEDSLMQKLYIAARKTAKTRFVAASRLEMHDRLSQWTLALASVVLLVVPLFQVFDLQAEYSSQELSAIQVLLAVIVLVFSLLVSFENFGVKAEKMHRCGTEINELAQEMRMYFHDPDNTYYGRFLSKYHATLQKYDNHKQTDFLMHKLQNTEEYFRTRREKVVASVLTYPRYLGGFSFYFLVMLVLIMVVLRVLGVV